MTKSILQSVLAAVFIGVAATPAWADASSKVTLSGFVVELFDLNPGDGIDPSVNFYGSGGSRIDTTNTSTLPPYSAYAFKNGDGVFGALTSATGSPQSGDSASISGNELTGLTIQTTAFARSTPGESSGLASATLGNNGGSALFTLSANTLMLILGNVDMDMTSSATTGSEYADGQVSFNLSGTTRTGSQRSNALVNGEASFFALGNNSDFQHTQIGVSFVNEDNQLAYGNFSANVTSVVDSVSTVPEASGLAMFLAGLASLGLARRRQRSNSDRPVA